MKVYSILNAKEENIFEATRALFGKLFEEEVIDYLLVPQHISKGRTLTQTLVKDKENLEGINPFSPVMAMNSAVIVSQLGNSESDKKIGVVMKPCEIRALVELVKLQQANLDNLVIIGVDCAGTFEIEDYAKFMEEEDDEDDRAQKELDLLSEIYSGSTDYQEEDSPMKLRSACQICNFFTPHMGDITLNFLGMEGDIMVTLESDLAEKMGLETVDEPESHKDMVEEIKNSRDYKREDVFDEFKEKAESINELADIVSTCIRCYACQTACPICYCRVCFFRTETFNPETDRILQWADKEGSLRMPTEILLYHLTRLDHVTASCVGCGMCESACPRGIPLSTLFQTVGHEVQEKLEYVPGRSIEDELPVATYRQQEEI